MSSDHGDDPLLLTQYIRTRDEHALSRIMERYMPMVYSVAHRTTRSHALAAETSQDVFLKLSQNPLALMRGVPLAAWLHRVARTRAIDLLRAEKRRTLLQEKLRLQDHSPSGPGLSEEGFVLLDEVIDQLPAPDRNLVLQRYLFGESFVALSRTLGISEDAARMRANRALEKMRSLFASRGVRTTSAILATALPAQGFLTPPPGLLAATLSKTSTAAASYLRLHLLKTLYLMTTTQKYAAAATVLAVAALSTSALVHQAAKNAGSQNSTAVTSSPDSSDRGHPIFRNDVTGPGEDHAHGPANRGDSKQGKLDEWIERWKKLPENPNPEEATVGQKSLIKNAVAGLSCSEDLIGFVKFLKSVKCPYAQDLVNAEVVALSKSDRAEEMRSGLLELANHIDKTNLEFLPPWIDAAGGACSKEDILQFSAALDDDGLKMAAMIGYDSVLAKTSPKEAIISTLDEYKKRYDPSSASGPLLNRYILIAQMQNLAPDAQFGEIERSIETETGFDRNRDEDIRAIRSSLLSKWSATDPAAAANYVMDNPDRIPPKYISSIAETVFKKDLDVGIEWAKTFPEGPYYDAAVDGSIFLVGERNLQEARDLAEKIQNKELRKQYASMLEKDPWPTRR